MSVYIYAVLTVLMAVHLNAPELLPDQVNSVCVFGKWLYLVLTVLSVIGFAIPNTPEQDRKFRRAFARSTRLRLFVDNVADVVLVAAFAAAGQYIWAGTFCALFVIVNSQASSMRQRLGVA